MIALAALGASATLAAMLFASRLPLGADFILPRRGGFALYRFAWAFLARPGGRMAFSAAVVVLLILCGTGLGRSLKRAVQLRPSGRAAWTGLALGPVFAGVMTWRLWSRSMDLIMLVWFPYAGLNALEPFATAALFALALIPASVAARDWVGGRRRRSSALLVSLVALEFVLAVIGAIRGVGRPLAAPAALGKTVYVVMTDGPRGPGRDEYALSRDIFADADARSYYRAAAAVPGDARTLPALRALYEEETKRWDLSGLRDALLLGVARGDALAPSLLLSHSAAVRPSPEALAALGAVSDERSWRVGPLGAAALARAYAHQGDRESAARWAAKAGEAGGVAPGLLGIDGAGSSRLGRVSGVLRAPGPARLALYLKEDPAAPYLLDAAGLVASAEPDARGRFSFSGLPAGRYYLAAALSGRNGRGEAAVSGNRGDLVIDAAHPIRDLPPLSITFIPR
ncbi:MAG: carboxypeptidase-like regulatory domain-containing protein [Elusimicrobiota bacterium]